MMDLIRQFWHLISTPDGITKMISWGGIPVIAAIIFAAITFEATGLHWTITLPLTYCYLAFSVLAIIIFASGCSSGGGGADGGTSTGPCKGVPCSNHGVCDDSSGRAVCICDDGFHPDGMLNCVASADPCAAVTCAEWKQCVNGACAVKTGRCDSAADCSGNAPCGADHTCQAYDPCKGVTCGGHGKCEASGYGYAAEVKCFCDQGFHADGLACVEDATGPCKDVTCDEWKECTEGGRMREFIPIRVVA